MYAIKQNEFRLEIHSSAGFDQGTLPQYLSQHGGIHERDRLQHSRVS